MAAADVSSLIEIASSPSPTTEQPIESTVEETPLETTVEETPESAEAAPEGEGAGEAAPEGDKAVDGRTNPAAIRSALKAFRDLDPKNAPIARELNNAYGRYTAYKDVFPKVALAQEAKAILDAVGGNEGITGLQETIKSVNETDALLYAGDPRVLDTLIEDFKAQNKLDAFGKLASPFLDKLQKVDEAAYVKAVKPHFYQGLVNAEFSESVGSVLEALSSETPNIESAKKTLTSMQAWFDRLRNSVETGAKASLDPERQAFEAERTEFQTTKQKAFQSDVNSAWNTENNRTLGEALKPYLKLPFAKNWTDGTKVSVAREITSTLLEELTADKTYQSQMDALWSGPNPDKAKILSFHKSKVAIIGPRIVKQVLENRYPGFAKVPGAKPKPAAGGSVAATPNAGTRAAGRPMYVTTKPQLDQMDMEKDPDRMLLATGRAYLRGSGKFVSWNPRDK